VVLSKRYSLFLNIPTIAQPMLWVWGGFISMADQWQTGGV